MYMHDGNARRRRGGGCIREVDRKPESGRRTTAHHRCCLGDHDRRQGDHRSLIGGPGPVGGRHRDVGNERYDRGPADYDYRRDDWGLAGRAVTLVVAIPMKTFVIVSA